MAPKKIVVDTSAFYALISSSDTFHPKAKLAYERLLDWEWELWTTSYVLLETSALVHHRLGFEPLRRFIETVLPNVVNVLWVESGIHHEAWKRMVERQGGRLSLVDWTTIVAATRFDASIFTFDQGFRSEGALTFPR